MARHPRWVRRVFSEDDLEAVRAAIAQAEAQTSAEIRLHLEHRVPSAVGGDALVRAREVFASLGMHRTRQRNGVLIYLALADRGLGIGGYEGNDTMAGEASWAATRCQCVGPVR